MQAFKQAKRDTKIMWVALTTAYKQNSDAFKTELQNIARAFAAVEAEKERYLCRYGDVDIDNEALLEINVGGRIITATRSVLTQQKGSMLEATFSGRWEKRLQRDNLGRIFLDMNPDCFQAIIEHLVKMKYSSEPKTKKICQAYSKRKVEGDLSKMMKYFGIKIDQTMDHSTLQHDETIFDSDEAQVTIQDYFDTTNRKALDIDEILSSFQTTLSKKQEALDDAKEELQKVKTRWEEEKTFIESIVPTPKDDLINLNVRGTRMTVRRSTLRIFKGSVLDRQFDDTVWPMQQPGKESMYEWGNEEVVDWAKGHAAIPEEITDLLQKSKIDGSKLLTLSHEGLKEWGPDATNIVIKAVCDFQTENKYIEVFIDHDEYDFRMIIEQLLRKALSKDAYQPLSLPDINKTWNGSFSETVDYYFPGEMAGLIWEKTVRCISVQNAGVMGVNGIYTCSGTVDGVSAYRKIGIRNEQEVEFSIFRCLLSDDTKWWYISIVPKDMKPGTDDDIDFYRAPVSLEHSDFPPEGTWLTVEKHGLDPPCKIIWKSDILPKSGEESGDENEER
mmetsp:Transcript_32127/g.46809  ORF Transcript_32127/g.46809 Transcript_32127/m.46809 type:complete len:559 (+) Transcript_32127:157-1833(+)